MNEKERSDLYIYTYSDLDDDFVFVETKYTLGDLHKLQKENKILKENAENNDKVVDKVNWENQLLKKENQQLKEDISFCLKSIKQEMEMSTDSRTKQEMLSCYQILSKWSDK